MQPQRQSAPLFTQVDISASPNAGAEIAAQTEASLHTQILQQILAAQDRQNELLEELVSQYGAAQRQRANELTQWRQANPQLAKDCRKAAEVLGRVQSEYLSTLAMEVQDSADVLIDGEFMLSEFVDRFGPRLAHLNGVLQVLSQLGLAPDSTNSAG